MIEVCYVLVYYVRAELTISNVTKWYVIIGNQSILEENIPDGKVHGANMGPIWVLSAPDGPHEPCYQGCQII